MKLLHYKLKVISMPSVKGFEAVCMWSLVKLFWSEVQLKMLFEETFIFKKDITANNTKKVYGLSN